MLRDLDGPAGGGRWSDRYPLLVGGIWLGVLLAALYGRLLFMPLLWDDPALLAALSRLEKVWTWPAAGFPDAGLAGGAGWFAPVVLASLRLDRWFCGAAAWGPHFIQLLWVLGTALLVWRLLYRWLNRPVLALLAVSLWLAHPLLVETVFLLSWRGVLISSFFLLAALNLYGDGLRRPDRPVLSWLALPLLALSLLSGPAGLLFPPLALILASWREEKIAWPQPAPVFWAGAGLAIAAGMVQYWGAARPAIGHPQGWLAWPLLAVYGLRFFVIPYPLAPERPAPGLEEGGATWAFLCLGALAVLGGVFWRCRRGWPWPLAGLLIYIFSLFPGVWALQRQPWLGDGFFFLPALGLSLVLAWGLQRGLEKLAGYFSLAGDRRRVLEASGAALIFLSLAAGQGQQARLWGDTLRFFQRAEKLAPKNQKIRLHLAAAYVDKNRFAEAAQTLAADPQAAANPAGLALVALIKGARGETAAALKIYDLILRQGPPQPGVLNNRAALLRQLQRPQEALADLEKAVALDPMFWDGQYNLGLLYREAGRKEEAKAAFLRAAQIRLTADLAVELAILYAEQRQIEPALTVLQQGIAADRSSPQAYNMLGILYAETQAMGKAEAVWQEGLRFHPGDPLLKANLQKLQNSYTQ